MRLILDEDGNHVEAGDVIRFSYGIPPVRVDAPIVERDGKLIAITKGHNPAESELRSLRYHVGLFHIIRKHTDEER